MPNPSIDWTDGIGAASLVCLGLTFMNWTPDVIDVGETAIALASPLIHFFAYRQDNIIAFDIANIANSEIGLALRLKSWLTTGGSVMLHMADAAGTVYLARVGPGTIPVFKMTDTTELEYTLSLVLIAMEETDTAFEFSGVSASRSAGVAQSAAGIVAYVATAGSTTGGVAQSGVGRSGYSGSAASTTGGVAQSATGTVS